jgi:ATP-binding cassette subfamily F protein uup
MPPPILTLRGVSLRFGAEPLFADVELAIGARERLCLVGRNGSGKSTLLKLIAAEIEPDAGARWVRPGLRIARLAQAVDAGEAATVADFVAAGGGDRPAPAHAVAAALAPLGLAPEAAPATLSGGEARRAALARTLVGKPELLLLDEPTNHLDLPTIEWLERALAGFRGAVVLVSHDRALLARLTRRTAWLDRGRLHVCDRGFDRFEEWQEQVYAADARTLARLDQRLAAETEWLRKGITARRRRNQGRLRALEALRAERRAVQARAGPGAPAFAPAAAEHGGRVALEAERVSKRYAARVVVREVSIRVLRGDRVALSGPNGAGKTTLLRLLAGTLAPDAGTLRLGAGLRAVFFDQDRTALDPEKTLWQTLCPGGGDTVSVRGRRRHVVGFLKDFLFAESQALGPVGSLSGGEQSRLLLAMLLARPSNLLVLDEPTNDLDLETLELLEELLSDYDGTVLMASHDRALIDRLATHTLWLAGDGAVETFVGGYADMVRQRGEVAPAAARPRAPARAARARTRRVRLGYRDQRELEALPARIAALEDEIAALEARLSDAGLYGRDRAAFAAASARLGVARAELEGAEERWLELAEAEQALRDGGVDGGRRGL